MVETMSVFTKHGEMTPSMGIQYSWFQCLFIPWGNGKSSLNKWDLISKIKNIISLVSTS